MKFSMVAGYLSLLYSISDKPLEYWSKRLSSTGRIRKILDSDLLENVVEIQDLEHFNISNTSIACPANPLQLLNIKLPFLVVVIKNINIECRIRLQVIDNKNRRHHFQFSTAEVEKDARIQEPTICRVKLKLESNWNKLELDLPTLTRDAFNCEFVAVQRLEICANCRLRRIYFVDKHYQEFDISAELWQAFLDLYMLKWNIHGVNAVTQITEPPNCKSGNEMSLSLSTNVSPSDVKVTKCVQSDAKQAQIGSHAKKGDFLKALQTKCIRLIDDFFSRRDMKLSSIKDFKRRAEMKPYSLPLVVIEESKKYPSNKSSSMNLEKHYQVLDFPSGSNHSRITNGLASIIDQRHREQCKIENTEEKWRNKQFPNKLQSAKHIYPMNKSKKVQSISFMTNAKIDHEKRFLDMQRHIQQLRNKTRDIAGSKKSESYVKANSGIFKKYADLPKTDLKTFTSVALNPAINTKGTDAAKYAVSKKDSVLQRTIFDLRRTYVYMNLIDKNFSK